MKYAITTTLALALAGSIAAAPEGGDGPKPERERRGPPPEILEKFDTNGDGKLDETERKAAMQARREQAGQRREKMLEKFDTNGDGKLDESEREAMKKEMEAKRKEILDKYDTDGDGKLSPEERQAAIDAGEKLPPHRRGPGAHDRKRPGGDGGGPRPGGPRRGKGGPDAPDA